MAVVKDIKACVFDAYGTLFDVHSSVRRYQNQLGDIANSLSNVWRQKQLEYTWLRSLMQRHTDFWQVTSHALDYAFDTFKVDNDQLKSELLNAYLQLDCYPEVPEILTRLRQHSMRLAILSNGSPHMLASAVSASGIHDLLDELISVEAVGIYKPATTVYRLAVDRLGVSANSMLPKLFSEIKNIKTMFPSRSLCTDNAAMVAGLAYHMLKSGDYPENFLALEAEASQRLVINKKL